MGIVDDKGISVKLVGLVMFVVVVSAWMRCCKFVDAGETVMRCIDKERQALVTLKQGFIDPSGYLSSWGSEECCNWDGVFCSNTTGHVTTLQLDSFGFGGSISSVCSINNTNLVLLDLSNNQLAGTLPDCWENVTGLELLNLSNNSLSSDIPPSLGSLTNLISLHLGRNNLSGDLPSTLKNCRLLQMIDVGGNNLTGNVPQWLSENFKNLTYLSLRGNKFHGGIPPEICKLTNLQVLDLSRNDLSGINPPCFDNYTSLVDKSETTTSKVRIYSDDRYNVTLNYFINYALVP